MHRARGWEKKWKLGTYGDLQDRHQGPKKGDSWTFPAASETTAKAADTIHL